MSMIPHVGHTAWLLGYAIVFQAAGPDASQQLLIRHSQYWARASRRLTSNRMCSLRICDYPASSVRPIPLVLAHQLLRVAGCPVRLNALPALQDAGCIPPLAAALALPGATATAATSALCSLCNSRPALQELSNCSGCSRLVAAAAQPKWLTPRGQRTAVRLLRRLVRAVSSCRVAVQEQLAAAGLQLQLA
jgi:hypothetical protein